MSTTSVKAQRLKEREPIKGDWQTSLIIASRRSLTPWRDVSELVELPIDECKARLKAHNATHAPTTPEISTPRIAYYD